MAFWTGGSAGSGVTVLIEGHARPRRPSPAPEANSVESFLASSISWEGIVMDPIVRVSV